jgi:hypothetical protein
MRLPDFHFYHIKAKQKIWNMQHEATGNRRLATGIRHRHQEDVTNNILTEFRKYLTCRLSPAALRLFFSFPMIQKSPLGGI